MSSDNNALSIWRFYDEIFFVFFLLTGKFKETSDGHFFSMTRHFSWGRQLIRTTLFIKTVTKRPVWSRLMVRITMRLFRPATNNVSFFLSLYGERRKTFCVSLFVTRKGNDTTNTGLSISSLGLFPTAFWYVTGAWVGPKSQLRWLGLALLALEWPSWVNERPGKQRRFVCTLNKQKKLKPHISSQAKVALILRQLRIHYLCTVVWC